MSNFPLVSCLCVTRKRIEQLKRAIHCYNSQTYPNKQLVVVSEDDDEETTNFMNQFELDDLKHIVIDSHPKKTLGELRNIAIRSSDGEYICQWDDDDWYHIERLSKQVFAAIDNHHPGSILTNWIMFDELEKQAYFSVTKWWEGTILFKKDELMDKRISYPAKEKKEDTIFIEEIISKSKVFPLVSPNMYIYTFHGKNTWDRSHFESNFKFSQKLSPPVSLLIDDILSQRFSCEEASALLANPNTLQEFSFLHAYRKEVLQQHNA